MVSPTDFATALLQLMFQLHVYTLGSSTNTNDASANDARANDATNDHDFSFEGTEQLYSSLNHNYKRLLLQVMMKCNLSGCVATNT